MSLDCFYLKTFKLSPSYTQVSPVFVKLMYVIAFFNTESAVVGARPSICVAYPVEISFAGQPIGPNVRSL